MIDRDQLRIAALPLMRLLRAEFSPHCRAVVTQQGVEIVADDVFFPRGDEESVNSVMVEPLSPKTSWMDKLADKISRQIPGEANRDIPSK